MATNPDRSSYFLAIKKKYEQPMSYWFDQMKEISDRKYPEQIAYLRENYGFTQAHANPLVPYSRGSTTSRRYNNMDGYLRQFDDTKQETVRYIIGVSVHQNHILLSPTHTEVLTELATGL